MLPTREQLQTFADSFHLDDPSMGPPERCFDLLVALASHLYRLYLEEDVPDVSDPSSFKPRTLGGASHGWALIQGLIENLEMIYPDGNFRTA